MDRSITGALVGSIAAFALVKLGAWLTSSYYGDDSWFQVIFAHTVPNGVWGYIWVYLGVFIAPRAKITVAIIFGCVVLSVATLGVFINLQQREWWNLVADLSALVGAIIAAVAIARGEDTDDIHDNFLTRW